MVHANNPHGFAHERRVNEDNIDLNRNFIDFDDGLPESPGYAELHPTLVPEAWNGEARETAEAAIKAYIQREGLSAFQQVTSRGQYTHPDGLFYGGTGPSWSRRIIEGFAREHLARAERIALIDFHTGLGPRGYGEIIGRGGPGDPQYERTVAWYGTDVKSAAVGNSASVRLNGTIDFGYRRVCRAGDAITLGNSARCRLRESPKRSHWLTPGRCEPPLRAIKTGPIRLLRRGQPVEGGHLGPRAGNRRASAGGGKQLSEPAASRRKPHALQRCAGS